MSRSRSSGRSRMRTNTCRCWRCVCEDSESRLLARAHVRAADHDKRLDDRGEGESVTAWQLAFEHECDVAFRAWGLEQCDRLAALKAQGAL
jgi:hypothetical protein